ncbi:C4-dicarboxylate TRAP transporter substrate-binding protein [uncultured Marinobacter sp.]|uniref:C4-dicarboxylate TRAP transporter substrate-binding protein n=1 Tax=uncultured Marinobacter sp. TaxID=187379 RepID=UPI0030DD6F03
MNLRKGITHTLSAALVAGCLGSTSVSAETLRYALGYPPGSDSAKAAEHYADMVKEYSNGELNVRVYPLSLLNFAETSAGLRDGITDIGYLLSPYFPAEYPHTNLLAEAAMQTQLLDESVQGKEGPAYVGALLEYIFFHCDGCNNEFKAQNQVFTGMASSSNYMLNCNTPVTSVADLRGKRLRAAGSQWSRWATGFGATPVTLSGNDAMEALSQGVVDCVLISAPDLENLGIIEATTNITTDMPGGVFAGAPIANTNMDTWRRLSDDQRRAMLQASAHISAEIPFVYHAREADVLERASSEMGIKLHKAEPDLVNATREFVRGDMTVIAQYYKDRHGVQNGVEMLEEFRPILEKWVGLVQDVDSKEALAEVYWTEVLSKVDPSKHGL